MDRAEFVRVSRQLCVKLGEESSFAAYERAIKPWGDWCVYLFPVSCLILYNQQVSFIGKWGVFPNSDRKIVKSKPLISTPKFILYLPSPSLCMYHVCASAGAHM